MKTLIIGSGVHGLFLSYFLKKRLKNIDITILEKNSKICSGSSSSTHNRANRGFHYPRSDLTSKECKTGWNFFRIDEWRFPILSNPNLGIYLNNNLIYSDSIPLFALFFKIFNFILPDNFQYFSLWILFSLQQYKNY